MAVSLAGLSLPGPLIAAAGTFGYVREFEQVTDYRALGAIVTKSITAEPRDGNEPWRVVDLPAGMLNAIGLANVGVERFMAEKIPDVQHVRQNVRQHARQNARQNGGPVVIGSIAGHRIEEYAAVAAAFDGCEDLPAVELNVSCPNTATGRQFGDDPQQLAALLDAIRPVLASTAMFVKLSPGAPDIVAMAAAAVEHGADGLTLINTYPAMAIDVESRSFRISRGAGGLSGPAIHPIAVKMVHDVHRDVAGPAGVPIIGLGGVVKWQDAAEFILAGATAVGVGTGLFVDPNLPAAINRGLQRWARRQGVSRLEELRGALNT